MAVEEQLSKQLKALSGSKAVILGIGNELKGDDAVGPFLCEQLAGKTCAQEDGQSDNGQQPQPAGRWLQP